jgi:hypothetical protein
VAVVSSDKLVRLLNVPGTVEKIEPILDTDLRFRRTKRFEYHANKAP